MAYRQLGVIAFAVLGLVAVGCGQGQTLSASDPSASGDAVPSNSDDAPPANADQAPTNIDQPPGNVDSVPGNVDSPGGGRLGALCDQLCARLAHQSDQCNEGMNIFGTGDVCSGADACQVPADVPCENEIAGLFDCLLSLDTFCSGGQSQAEGRQCARAFEDFGGCADTIPNDTPNPSDNGQSCTAAGGCDCPSDCQSCFCENPGAAAADACVDICSTP